MGRQSLGRQFGWLWAAYSVSTFGTWLAFDAFPLIAILVLHAGPAAVSALAAAGLAVGAVVAVPLGPWVEFRRKRPVMVAMDLARFAAVLSVPAAYALGWLSFAQLSSSRSSSPRPTSRSRRPAARTSRRSCRPATCSSRTPGSSRRPGPPPRSARRSAASRSALLGPVTTVLANAVSFVLSAAGIRAIGGAEPRPRAPQRPRLRAGDLLDGLAAHLTNPALRPLFVNTILVNGLILATAPLVAVLMLGDLGFAPWQYGLAFGAPCVGGLVGSRLARAAGRAVRAAQASCAAGTLRACWSLGSPSSGPGAGGLVLVIVVQLGLVTCMGVFNPVFATYRLEQTETGPRRPHAGRVVGDQQRHGRGADGALGSAGRAHRPAHRDRGRRRAAAGDPAAAPPRRDRTSAPELVGSRAQ